MIVIGCPHAGAIPGEWFVSWEQLQKPMLPNGESGHVVMNSFRQMVHMARNSMIETMLRQCPEATHIFFVDDDVIIPPDGLARLLQDSIEHDLPVVTGLYTRRTAPHMPVVYRLDPEDGTYVHLSRFCDGLQSIDGCGAGCLLIRADVLRAIPAPWFEWQGVFSEDLVLCRKIREAGFPIVLDFGVQCGHLGVIECRYEHFAYEMETERVDFGTEHIRSLSQTVNPWRVAVEHTEASA